MVFRGLATIPRCSVTDEEKKKAFPIFPTTFHLVFSPRLFISCIFRLSR